MRRVPSQKRFRGNAGAGIMRETDGVRLGNQLHRVRRPGQQFCHSAIECREPSTILNCEREQVRVDHLSIADDSLEGRRIRIRRGYVITPETVPRKVANLS